MKRTFCNTMRKEDIDFMLNRLLGFITLFLFFFIFINGEDVYAQSIQTLIDEAAEGETIQLPNGTYNEPIVINKSVHLIGNDSVRFNVHGEQPAITIEANNVTLQHISIQYENEAKEIPAIFISSSNNTLENISIETANVGILLDDAHDNLLTKISITGKENLPIRDRRRGIDLWKAHRNIIEYSKINYVEDGIYEEFCQDNVFRNNKVTDSRYGYHLMFTDRTELYENESYENISGMMIMGTTETHAYKNLLMFNQKNVQSLGLLLFDVYDSLVEHNVIKHNRIGILVEDAYDNEVQYNDISNNFVGLQFTRAEDNIIHHNTFDANVVQGQAENSMHNDTNYNYWSDHNGLDVTGDGLSNLSYKVDPFYLHLTNKYPAYRLLFQAPGMTFLDSMMHTPVEEQLVDESPLMENPIVTNEFNSERNFLLAIISTSLFLVSLFIIFLGVRQT